MGSQPVPIPGGFLSREKSAQDQNFPRDAGLAQADPFVQTCYGEPSAPGRRKRLADWREPVPIGVGLHHGDDFDAITQNSPQRLVVPDDSSEIDFGARARHGCRGRFGNRSHCFV